MTQDKAAPSAAEILRAAIDEYLTPGLASSGVMLSCGNAYRILDALSASPPSPPAVWSGEDSLSISQSGYDAPMGASATQSLLVLGALSYEFVKLAGRLSHPGDEGYYFPGEPDDERDALHNLIGQAREIMSRPETAPPPSGSEPSAAWQLIETAPRDGTPILVGHSHSVFDAYWDEEAFGWVDGTADNYGDLTTFQPTHWQPLPEAPR